MPRRLCCAAVVLVLLVGCSTSSRLVRSYVGVDTFWGLIVGFKQLMDEADRATTFNELRAAGERYGRVMGRNAARAFAMLATAALGNMASGLAAQVPKLPGALQAAVQAETQLGIRLAAVGEVQTVAVSAEAVTLNPRSWSGGHDIKRYAMIPLQIDN